MAQLVKNLPARWETWVRSLGWEDPLEKGNYPLQYSGLGNSMDCIVHGVAESNMTEQLSLFQEIMASCQSQNKSLDAGGVCLGGQTGGFHV